MSRLGRPRLHLRRTASTNERARELAAAGAPHGTLVSADEQSAGRGRQGRRWLAPAGSCVLMSLLLRDPPTLTPLSAALAVCDVAGAGALIKWPNDVVLARPSGSEDPQPALAKLAGILIEARPAERWAVLGIGVNVALRLEDLPPELRQPPQHPPRTAQRPAPLPAATLGLERSAVEPTLQSLLAALGERLAQDAAGTLTAWRERDALAGREIAWGAGTGTATHRGRAQGIDGEGRLLVRLADGTRTALAAGEVHLAGVTPATA